MRVSVEKAAEVKLDSRRTCHEFLSKRFGKRFGELISKPIAVIQKTMRQYAFSVDEAVDLLIQRAQDSDPTGCAATITWLDAACIELLEGTPVDATAEAVLL